MFILAADPQCPKCRETPGFLVEIGDQRILRIKTLHGLEEAPLRLMCTCVRSVHMDVTNDVQTIPESIVHKPTGLA